MALMQIKATPINININNNNTKPKTKTGYISPTKKYTKKRKYQPLMLILTYITHQLLLLK